MIEDLVLYKQFVQAASNQLECILNSPTYRYEDVLDQLSLTINRAMQIEDSQLPDAENKIRMSVDVFRAAIASSSAESDIQGEITLNSAFGKLVGILLEEFIDLERTPEDHDFEYTTETSPLPDMHPEEQALRRERLHLEHFVFVLGIFAFLMICKIII